MKKSIVALLLASMVLGCTACQSTSTNTKDQTSDESIAALSSAEDVTADYIILATTPSVLAKSGPFCVTQVYEETGDESLNGTQITFIYELTGEIYEVSESVLYTDGYETRIYFSTDAEDPNYYVSDPDDVSILEMDDDYAEEQVFASLMGYSSGLVKIENVAEYENYYVATVAMSAGNSEYTDMITLDAATGQVVSATAHYQTDNGSEMSVSTTFDYSDGISVDRSAKEDNQKAGDQTASDSASVSIDTLDLNTEDINGNPVSSEMIADAKLVMLNLWEPWCGPCVNEMPDLQKLYENYKDQGLIVIGAYSSFDMQSDAEDIVSENNITYPIIKCSDALSKLEQDYVPATYFADATGKIIVDEPYIGSRSYEDWEAVVKELLESVQ